MERICSTSGNNANQYEYILLLIGVFHKHRPHLAATRAHCSGHLPLLKHLNSFIISLYISPTRHPNRQRPFVSDMDE